MRARLWRSRWWLNRLLYAAAIVLPLALAIVTFLVTLAGKLHVDQGAGLTAVAAVASALTPALRWLPRRQAQESKRQAELHELVQYLGPVKDAEPERLGVAPSQADDRRYLPRPHSDQLIQTHLASDRFVVVVANRRPASRAPHWRRPASSGPITPWWLRSGPACDATAFSASSSWWSRRARR